MCTEINKYYHEEKRRTEQWEHRRRMMTGKNIQTGQTYRGISLRNGEELNTEVTTLFYDAGTLLLKTNDGRFVFINADVTELNGNVYTDDRPVIVNIHGDMHEIMSANDPAAALRRAASYKWMSLLSERNAGLIVKWWKENQIS